MGSYPILELSRALAFGRSTAGNDVVATIVIILFLFFSVTIFSHRRSAYFAKVAKNAQKPRDKHLSRPRQPFWGPLAAILGFAGGAALQAVRHCRR